MVRRKRENKFPSLSELKLRADFPTIAYSFAFHSPPTELSSHQGCWGPLDSFISKSLTVDNKQQHTTGLASEANNEGCLVEKQAGTAGVNKSGDLILGDYLIYWLCGEVWLTELQLFKCSLGGNILLGWTCWLFACRRTGHRGKQKDLGWSQHPELCREVSSSLVRADVLSHTVVPVRQNSALTKRTS